jgi:hypothetical protein
MKGKKRKVYFDGVHELWDKHMYAALPLQYYNNKFELVPTGEPYSFVTIDPRRIQT